MELNLADFDQLDIFVKKVYDQCGNIDILINNGGISYRGSILETKLEVDQEIMTVNYFGSVALTKGKFYFEHTVCSDFKNRFYILFKSSNMFFQLSCPKWSSRRQATLYL